MSAVLIASITELCVADHQNRPEALANWLANKSPDGVRQWFGNPANTMLVAERQGEIAACGAFNSKRWIILNYVSPRHRFAGVSRALLADMERRLGPGEAQLESTATARQFYLDAGWQQAGPAQPHGLIPAYAMRKALSASG